MSLSLKIALRYLRAKKSHTAVNVITIISVAAVAVATMAMVVVLSVFNGFADLSAAHLSRLDPPLQVTLHDSPIIANADSLAEIIGEVEGVDKALPTLSRRALLVTDNAQTPVVFKGVADGYDDAGALSSIIVDGEYFRQNTNDTPAVQVSVGVANKLMVIPSADISYEIYVPRRVGRINPANPSTAFRGAEVVISGVFRVDQPDIDTDYIIIPLQVAREILDYENEAGAIDIHLKAGADIDATASAIASRIGDRYDVKNRLEQRAESFRMIQIEKWVTFMMMIFIMVIALFNIVSTMSLLTIEKRDNMQTLSYIGASRSLITRVFSLIGFIITVTGAVIGVIIGVILSLIQQHYGLIHLNADASVLTVSAYPVRVSAVDLVAVLALSLVIAALVSLLPRLLKILPK